jgi:tetratricopeptide (TPR) repeat protein
MAENKKDILKMAMIYSQEGKWDKAIVEYKKLVTLDPTDYNVHNMLGDVYAKKGEDSLAYQSYIIAAEAYIKQGLADKTNLIYKKISKLNSDKLPEADRKKQIFIKKNTEANTLIEQGDIDKAIETLKEILQINPDSFETYQKIGELYYEKGQKEEALKYFQRIAELYYKNRAFKKALPIYQKMVEMQPNNIEYREILAEIYEREERESDAKREVLFLADYYLKNKNWDKVDYFAQKAVELKSIDSHYYKGVVLYNKKDLTEAKKEFEMLIKFKKNHIESIFYLVKICIDTGKIDEAITNLQNILKIQGENTEALEMLGDLYFQKGLNKDAILKYYMIAVNIHIKNKEFEKAENILNKVLTKEPENIEILNKLADIQVQLNKKKQAADIYIKISEIYKKEKLEEKEKEYLKLAEELDPAHPKIIERAKKLSSEFTSQKPQPKTQEKIIEPPVEIKIEPKEVKKEPQKIVKEDFGIKKEEIKIPETKSSFELPDIPAENIILEPPKKVENLPHIEKVTQQETKEDVPSLLALADSFIKTGDFDQAIEMYQKALTIEPDNEIIKSKLNKVYSQYAGVFSTTATVENKKQEEEKKKQEAEKKKQEEEIKRQEEEKKKQEAEKKKQEEEKKKQEEEKKKQEEERKKQEEEKKKQEAEKKKQEEERKTQEESKKQEVAIEKEVELDFITVTSADIFIKQGLLMEAEKILNRIIKKDTDNLEAKAKLEELRKLKSEVKEEGKKDKDKSQGKVSYI